MMADGKEEREAGRYSDIIGFLNRARSARRNLDQLFTFGNLKHNQHHPDSVATLSVARSTTSQSIRRNASHKPGEGTLADTEQSVRLLLIAQWSLTILQHMAAQTH